MEHGPTGRKIRSLPSRFRAQIGRAKRGHSTGVFGLGGVGQGFHLLTPVIPAFTGTTNFECPQSTQLRTFADTLV